MQEKEEENSVDFKSIGTGSEVAKAVNVSKQ